MKKLILLPACLFALIGCSDDNDGIQAAENCTTDAEFCSMVARSSCEGSSIVDLAEHNSLEFNGNTFKRVQRFYASADCSTAEAAVVEYKGEFTVDEEAVKGRPGAMNIALEKGSITVNDETTADLLSAVNFCGVDSYEVGKSYEIKGEQTEGLCPIQNMPVRLYGAYEIDGDKLMLDNNISDMSTSEKNRDTDLDVVYIID